MSSPTRKEIEDAITALETKRDILGEDIVKTSIFALKGELNKISGDDFPKHQRKLVTVLFLDIVNSTELSRDLDPEEIMMVLDVSLQELSAPITNHGGRVTRYMGDGFLAVFGLPLASENDPQLAIQAGLDIISTTGKIAENLQKEWNIREFRVRIGIDTGLVVTGGLTEAEDTIMGNTVNLASRLETHAPPNSILISQNTYQHVHDKFEFESMDQLTVKGFAHPIDVYMVKKAIIPEFTPFQGIEGSNVPMVGREAEMHILRTAIEDIDSSSQSQMITIVSDAGLGKSRLLYEFEKWVQAHIDPSAISILKGRATPEFMSLPFRFVRDLILPRFRILDGDEIDIVKQKLIQGFSSTFGENNDIESISLVIGQLLGYDFRKYGIIQELSDPPRLLHERALSYIVRYLKLLAAERRILILLDDIHWTDDSSLDFIQKISQELRQDPILIICLARPSLFDRRPVWGEGVLHLRINLFPLPYDDCKYLVYEILKNIPNVPESLTEMLISTVGGNPYYIEELVKMMIEDEIIIRSNGSWSVVENQLNESQIPPTLTGVLQARLDKLPAEERAVLQQAAVIGRVFWDKTIEYIIKIQGVSIDKTLQSVFTTLSERELITTRESSSFSDATEYTFKNIILREVTYQSVLKKTRQVYHAYVADWLIDHSGDRVGEVSGLIALHLEESGNIEKALEYLYQAVNIAFSSYALEEADVFIVRALALTPETDFEKRYSLLSMKEKILAMQGNRDAQRKTLDLLSELAEKGLNENKKFEILLRKSWMGYWTSDLSSMLVAAEEAEGIAEKIQNPELKLKATYAKVWALVELGKFDDAEEYTKQGLEIARKTNNLIDEGNLLNVLGMVHNSRGEFFLSKKYSEEFLSITRTLGVKERVTTALNNLGVALTKLGKLDLAKEQFLEIVEICEETGNKVFKSTAIVNLAWVETIRQNWDLALSYANEGLQLKRQSEHEDAVAECLVWLGHCWVGLNETEKAVSAYREALEIRRYLQQLPFAMGAIAGLARTEVQQDNLENAMMFVEEIIQYLEGGGNLTTIWEPLRIYLTIVEILLLVNDDRSYHYLQEAYELLQCYLDSIPNAEDRIIFIENIPWRAKIIKLWNETNS